MIKITDTVKVEEAKSRAEEIADASRTTTTQEGVDAADDSGDDHEDDNSGDDVIDDHCHDCHLKGMERKGTVKVSPSWNM